MKELTLHLIRFVLIMVMVYLMSGDGDADKIMITYRRFMHKQSWSLATFTQRLAIREYRKYREEVDA